MKEVLTRKFWQDVKKTFNDAREGRTPDSSEPAPATSADAKPAISSPEPPAASPERPVEDA